MSREFPENLYKKAKSKIKTATAIGMATMAFSGAGNFEKTKGGEDVDVETKIVSIKGSEKSAVNEDTGKASGKYENAKREADRLLEEMSNISSPKREAEKIRRDLINHVGSKEYLDKLTLEYGEEGIDKAKNIQKERLDRLSRVKIEFVDKKNIGSKRLLPNFVPDRLNVTMPDWLLEITGTSNVKGFYDKAKDEIILLNVKNDAVVRLELSHSATKGDVGISEKAKKILTDSYRKTGERKTDSYFGNVSERLVRKQKLDYDMERLGIKKYGEEFKKEHHDKLIECFTELSGESQEFMQTTTLEQLELIFNGIATNKNVDSDFVKHA